MDPKSEKVNSPEVPIISIIKVKCKRVTTIDSTPLAFVSFLFLSCEYQKKLKQNKQGKMNITNLDIFHKSLHNFVVGIHLFYSSFSNKYTFCHWRYFDMTLCMVLFEKNKTNK